MPDLGVPPAAAAQPAPGGGSPAEAAVKVPVSVIVPTLNEAKNLPRCLDALRWADDVIVVDSHSRDGTPEIAQRHGARVIDFRWDGRWPKKRNWVLRHGDLRHEWVLIVDADEVIVPELAREVAEAIRSDRCVGFYVNRRFMFLGRWIKHCGYYPSWNLRLIKRGFAEYEKITEVSETGSGDNEVHEHMVAAGPVGHLKHDMLHFAFPDINTFVEKHNRYSNWEAIVQLNGASKRLEVTGNAQLTRNRRLKELARALPFRPTIRFLYSYVWRLGFLDGRAGLLFCRLLAEYEFLCVAKYYELRQAARASGQA